MLLWWPTSVPSIYIHMNKPDNNMDLIIRALENNLPMNEIYELNDHGINIFKQT